MKHVKFKNKKKLIHKPSTTPNRTLLTHQVSCNSSPALTPGQSQRFPRWASALPGRFLPTVMFRDHLAAVCSLPPRLLVIYSVYWTLLHLLPPCFWPTANLTDFLIILTVNVPLVRQNSEFFICDTLKNILKNILLGVLGHCANKWRWIRLQARYQRPAGLLTREDRLSGYK